MDKLVFKGQNDQILTTSLMVAEKFGKEHQHVLRDVRSLIEGVSNLGDTPMFVETTYINEQNGQEYPMFVMNRDGFTLLVMGYTGKKALKFKLDYIAAFNSMEKQLREQQQKPLTSAQMFALQANINLEYENRISKVEQRLNAIEQEREENGKRLLETSISNTPLPQMSLRDQVRQLVNQYSSANNMKQPDVWHKIYDQMYYLYHISIRAYKRNKGENNLDVAERNSLLDKMYNIISNLIRESRK